MQQENILGILQVILGVIAIVITPQLYDAFIKFRQKVDIISTPHSKNAEDGRTWSVKFHFKCNLYKEASIILQPSRPGNRFILVSVLNANMKNYDLYVNECGRVFLKIPFAAKDSSIEIRVHLSRRDIPIFYSDRTDMNISNNVIYAYANTVNLHDRLLLIARWRVIWIIAQFTIISSLCLIRLIYLSIFN